MTALEKWEQNKQRIRDGIYRIGDFDFRKCDCCRSNITFGCDYINKEGIGVWACGFCRENIKFKDEKMVYKIAIDADSIVSKSLHRYPDDMEMAYYNFCSEVGKIQSAVFLGLHTYEKGDSVEIKIILTPRTNFRYDIYPEYKAKRPERSEERKTLMKLIYDRLKSVTEIHKNVEADDVVIYYAKQGWLVAAIDKDVINACPTYCYNYNKYEWSTPSPDYVIEKWYLIQSLMGDSTDNIKGAKGIGEKGAYKIVEEMDFPVFANIIQYFESYDEALMNMRLVRMDQWNGQEVVLWEPTMETSLI